MCRIFNKIIEFYWMIKNTFLIFLDYLIYHILLLMGLEVKTVKTYHEYLTRYKFDQHHAHLFSKEAQES